MVTTEGLEGKLQQILNDPDSMAQILSMAQSFGLQGSPGQPEPQSAPPPNSMPDGEFLRSIMGLMEHARHSDGKQEALLCALKPFLRPEQRESIDRALQIARISHLAGFALRNYGNLTEKRGG